ncbi:phosphatase PAP2 family protein [Chitinispirillales bacterium ANBcel5]|uniref:phosphatase PAP2 family protein n=1 Tax=Cellulosispirillum alkaliphilum TaxID=3039283 RepID=UPI002A50E1D5|nr:phosphatase PAP2 family protein [Chitinispirillales bacterium ANBcel5]
MKTIFLTATIVLTLLQVPSPGEQIAADSCDYLNYYSNQKGNGTETDRLNYPGTKTVAALSFKNYMSGFLSIPVRAGKEIAPTDSIGLARLSVTVFASVALLSMDQTIRDLVRERFYSGSNRVSQFLYNVGRKEYFFPGLATTYGLSLALRNRYFHDTVLLSFQSLLVTQAVTELLKSSVNRVRPRSSPDNPFLLEKGNQSFVSGHASGVWSVMTVIAERYPRLKVGAYSLATAVALARVYEDAHWMSDVILGSALGYGIGRITANSNQPGGNRVTLSPFISQEGGGTLMNIQF